jgi:hypothetical protein
MRTVYEEGWLVGLQYCPCGIVRIRWEHDAFRIRMGAHGHWSPTEIIYDVMPWIKYGETCLEF